MNKFQIILSTRDLYGLRIVRVNRYTKVSMVANLPSGRVDRWASQHAGRTDPAAGYDRRPAERMDR